jgi:hypothetical protein
VAARRLGLTSVFRRPLRTAFDKGLVVAKDMIEICDRPGTDCVVKLIAAAHVIYVSVFPAAPCPVRDVVLRWKALSSPCKFRTRRSEKYARDGIFFQTDPRDPPTR